jgi:pimeloyl-ACP methyl ester carboxylesterase
VVRAALIVLVLLCAAGPARAASFTDTYRYFDTWAWASEPKCVGGGQYGAITGQEPDSGTHPVFVWLHGTYAPAGGTEALKFVGAMAARGFVAAAVHYDDFAGFNAVGTDKKARCIFDPSLPASAITRLCARPAADCSRGIVVAGHSQGAVVAVRAANWNPQVRAVYALGFNEETTVEGGARMRAASAPPYGTRALPDGRLRIIDGEMETPVDRRDELNVQTGKSCPVTATDCLDAAGAGWDVVLNREVLDGAADHCYHHGGGGGGWGCKTDPPFDPYWLNGSAPWALNPSLDWLAGFTD